MSARYISVDTIKSTESAESQPSGLPVACDLKLAYALSFLIVLIMAASAAIGLLYKDVIYPTNELLLAFLPSDAFNLAVGLPLLLGSMWLARRGKLVGLLTWPGLLFCVLYVYIPYVVGVPFNVLFLPHLLLVVLSASTLIGIVASVDGELVRQELVKFVPSRVSAGVLITLAILIIVRQTALIVAALIDQTPVGTLETLSWIADFTVAIPALLVGGIQLWRRKPLGYVAGPGLLLGYGLLALSLIPFFIMQARYTASPIDAAGLVTILFMAALCFIPLVFFMRGATLGSSTNSA